MTELGSALPHDSGLVLERDGNRLAIRENGHLPFAVDFLTPRALARLSGAARTRHPLARAVGRRKPLPAVLDGTAGFGRDAVVLAALGYRVIAVERSPVVHALLADGLSRLLAAAPDRLGDRLTVVCATCESRLREAPAPEVVYLDPMFPERRKSALVKREMQLLQRLLPDEDDGAALLAAARQCAVLRVVVKRPAWAPPLAADVSFAVRGTKVRWDVYLAAGRT